MNRDIKKIALHLIKKYNTQNPFEIAETVCFHGVYPESKGLTFYPGNSVQVGTGESHSHKFCLTHNLFRVFHGYRLSFCIFLSSAFARAWNRPRLHCSGARCPGYFIFLRSLPYQRPVPSPNHVSLWLLLLSF